MSQTSFIHGFHAIIAKLRHQPEAILEIFIAADRHDARARDLLKHAELHSIRIMPVDPLRLEGMAGGGRRHQGVVARVKPVALTHSLDEVLENIQNTPLLVILDGVNAKSTTIAAPNNIADVFRAKAGIQAKGATSDDLLGEISVTQQLEVVGGAPVAIDHPLAA